MSFVAEMRANFRYLAGVSLGLSFGYMVNMYIVSIFSPHLIEEFGWTKSQFALLGTTILIGIVGMPIAGRLTDIFGSQRMATVGVILTPLVYAGFSLIEGSFLHYFLLTIVQVTLIGTTTTSAVYTRVIAERFDKARGIALSLAASSPAATAAILAPLLTGVIDDHGWRVGYLTLAGGSAIGGLVALLLISQGPRRIQRTVRASARGTLQDYRTILNTVAFRTIAGGILLSNLAHTTIGTQLKLILLDLEIGSDTASGLVSLFAIGVMLGRLFSGFALDRYPSRIVAAVVLGVPSIGLAILGSGQNDITVVGLAVLIVGLSTGAELDVAAYLVMRYFRLEIYGTAYGMIAAAIALSSASGSLFLSLVLDLTGRFSLYLLITSATTFLGGLIFLLLPGDKPADRSIEKASGELQGSSD